MIASTTLQTESTVATTNIPLRWSAKAADSRYYYKHSAPLEREAGGRWRFACRT